MSSTRVFILGALETDGPMHGYQLRVLATNSHLHNWTDITPGAIYGALKRLIAEGLAREVRTERDGARPERQIVEITDAGRAEVRKLRLQALTGFRLSPDPFDLAFARPGPELIGELPAILRTRRDEIAAAARDYDDRTERLASELSPLESLTMRHRLLRLRAEIAFLEHAMSQLSATPKKEHHTQL